jgi:hypothetical protein
MPGKQRSNPRAPLTDAERVQIRELAEKGGSARAIARQVGRSAATVSRVAGDLLGERREQTQNATAARQVDLADERTKLMEHLLRAARGGVGRWASVQPGDHRGSEHEAASINALVTAYTRLDDRHTRARGTQGVQVAAFVALMAGVPTPEAQPVIIDQPTDTP